MRGLLISAGRFWICACFANQPTARIMSAGVHLCTPLSCWFPSLQSCRRSTIKASGGCPALFRAYQEDTDGSDVLAECIRTEALDGDPGHSLCVVAVLHGNGQFAFWPKAVQDGDPVLDALLTEFVLDLRCGVYGPRRLCWFWWS